MKRSLLMAAVAVLRVSEFARSWSIPVLRRRRKRSNLEAVAVSRSDPDWQRHRRTESVASRRIRFTVGSDREKTSIAQLVEKVKQSFPEILRNGFRQVNRFKAVESAEAETRVAPFFLRDTINTDSTIEVDTPSVDFLRAITTHGNQKPVSSSPLNFFMQEDICGELSPENISEDALQVKIPHHNVPDPVPYNDIRPRNVQLPASLFPDVVNLGQNHQAMRGAAFGAAVAMSSTGMPPTQSVALGLLAATTAGLSTKNAATLFARDAGQFVFDQSLKVHNVVYPLFEQSFQDSWVMVTEVALKAQQSVEQHLVSQQWKSQRDPETPPAVDLAEKYEQHELYGGVRISNVFDRITGDVHAQ